MCKMRLDAGLKGGPVFSYSMYSTPYVCRRIRSAPLILSLRPTWAECVGLLYQARSGKNRQSDRLSLRYPNRYKCGVGRSDDPRGDGVSRAVNRERHSICVPLVRMVAEDGHFYFARSNIILRLRMYNDIFECTDGCFFSEFSASNFAMSVMLCTPLICCCLCRVLPTAFRTSRRFWACHRSSTSPSSP